MRSLGSRRGWALLFPVMICWSLQPHGAEGQDARSTIRLPGLRLRRGRHFSAALTAIVGTAVRSSAVSRRAKRRFGCVLVTHHEDTESVGSIERSGRIQRIDGDVVPVQIQKRKLRSADAGIEMRLLFQLADESARP
jgi:hypothetical protein